MVKFAVFNIHQLERFTPSTMMIDGPPDQSQFRANLPCVGIAEVAVEAVCLCFLNTTRFEKVQFVHINEMMVKV